VLNRLHLLWTLLSSTTSSHAKHLTQYVVHTSCMSSTTFLQTIDTILVINVSLFFVCEYFVGCLQLLEFTLVTSTIWMMFESQLSKSFFDFIEGSFLIYPKQIIIPLVVNFFRGAPLTGSTHVFKSSKWESTSAKKHFVKFKMQTQFFPY